MSNDFAKFLDDIGAEDDFATEGPRGPVKTELHPCIHCAGTGHWHPVAGRAEGGRTCYQCKGRGMIELDASRQRERTKKNAQANRKRLRTMAANEEIRRERNAALDIFGAVRSMVDWNDFAASLMEQHEAGRAWTENQIAAIKRIIAKVEETRKRKAEEAKASAPKFDLSPIREMFDAAGAHIQRPTYRAEGLVISLAPATGMNAGALYIKTPDGGYLGKLVGTAYIGDPCAQEALAKIAENPADAAVRYGRETGTCACCGRALTDPISIQAGIGPICAARFSFG